MFERMTDRARRVLVLAQEESRRLRHNYIGTEHILLGLIMEDDNVASRALQSLGVSLRVTQNLVENIIGQGQQSPPGHVPFTPRAKKVLELSLRESLQLGHNYIGTEHILLGLIREGEGVAAQVLMQLGCELTRVRQQVTTLLSGYQGKSVEPKPEPEPAEQEADEPEALCLVVNLLGNTSVADSQQALQELSRQTAENLLAVRREVARLEEIQNLTAQLLASY